MRVAICPRQKPLELSSWQEFLFWECSKSEILPSPSIAAETGASLPHPLSRLLSEKWSENPLPGCWNLELHCLFLNVMFLHFMGSKMEIIRIDRRNEARVPADLELVVWGVDTAGERFVQQAQAQNISINGALLTGLKVELKPGDVVGVLYGGRKARFRVVWVRYDGPESPMQAAVHRIDPDVCPWLELLSNRSAPEPLPVEAID
jgi:hypothetical protein